MLRTRRTWGPTSPWRPRTAHSLRQLAHDVDTRWPARERASDGWLGDAHHKARQSDHNPDWRGVVHAIDLDVNGLDPVTVLHAVLTHPSTHYAIWADHIYSRSRGFRPLLYSGPDRHESHIHVSILTTRRAERSTVAWPMG